MKPKSTRAIKNIEENKAEFADGTILYDEDLIEKYYKATYDALIGRKPTDNSLFPFIDKSIKGMLDKSRYDLGAKSLDKIDQLVKDTTEYFKSKEDKNIDFIEYKIAKTLFPWQKPIILFESHKNTLLAGRRAGKSHVEAAIAVMHCAKGYDTIGGFKKQRSVLVMGLTSERTKDVFWDNILHFIELSGLKTKIDASKLYIKFENGAEIFLRGNNSKVDREKLRGADYSLIIIDECQSQQSLQYLMVDILGPIIKGRDSYVFLSGTGAITNKGFWKDITDGELASEWLHYTATMRDNPTIPANAIEEVLKENKWTEDNITFRREYLAENITDTTRIVYPEYHTYEEVPANTIIDHLCIGIDYGWNDYNAIVALGKATNGKIYELETRKFNRTDVDNIVSNVKDVWDNLIMKYKIPNAICVADSSDQSISAQIQKRGIKIQNAYKVDRIQQIFDMREALRRADVLVKSKLITDDMGNYIWKFDEENKCVLRETDDDYFHSDVLPAMRYSWFYLKNK